MTSSTAILNRQAAESSAGFLDTFVSEWIKLITVRSNWLTLSAAIAVAIGMNALLAFITGNWAWHDFTPAEQAAFDPASRAFWILGGQSGASLFTMIVLAVFAVNFIAAEFSSGMIRTTITATPSRGRVLLAKIAVIAAVTAAAGLLASIGMFFVAQAIFGAYDLPTVGFFDADVWRGVVGVTLAAPVVPIAAACLAMIFRSAAPAIATIIALVFVVPIFDSAFPQWWQDNVVPYNLPTAVMSFENPNLTDPDIFQETLLFNGLEPDRAAVAIVFWLVAFVGAAYVALKRRDV